MWIDRIIELDPGKRIVTIKNVSLAEEHLHDHFSSTERQAAFPVMPASLIVEGMAQTAGILVGHMSAFKEKVVLAKVSKADLAYDVVPGQTITYTAQILQAGMAGVSTTGTVALRDSGSTEAGQQIGTVDLVFSHLDKNMAGEQFPKHNFVFGESFQTILATAGISFDLR